MLLSFIHYYGCPHLFYRLYTRFLIYLFIRALVYINVFFVHFNVSYNTNTILLFFIFYGVQWHLRNYLHHLLVCIYSLIIFPYLISHSLAYIIVLFMHSLLSYIINGAQQHLQNCITRHVFMDYFVISSFIYSVLVCVLVLLLQSTVSYNANETPLS